MTAALGAVAPLFGATSSKASSGSSSFILIIVVFGAAYYFLISRPQKKKQLAARTQTNAYEVGDEVVTAGGIVGYVLDITDDRVTLETSVGASFVVLKPYVLRKLAPAEPPTDEPQPPSGPPAVGEGDGHGTDDQSDEEPHDEAAPTTPPPDAGDEPEATGSEGPPTV